MRIISLASGSKGNVTLLEHNDIRLLIDAGLCCKELEIRLGLVGVEPSSISAIVISHNHTDHTKGVSRFANKYKVPVYACRECFSDVSLSKVLYELKREIGLDDFSIGDIVISTFEVPHDALKTIGFNFYCEGNKISLVTDVGEINDCIFHKLEGSNLVLIESNYDENMLSEGPYPLSLKRRIKSNMGHLSNRDCAKVILNLTRLGTKFFMLMHMSETNNTPEIAYNSVMNVLYDEYGEAMDTRVFLSYQSKASANFVLKSRAKGEKSE